MNCFGKYAKLGLSAKPTSQMCSLPKAGIANAAHCLPKEGSLPKAFQKQTSFAFGFFAPRLFTKASFRHILETKKPITL
jgi:hypothetical protein